MLNSLLTISNAYSTNPIQECRDAYNSARNIYRSSDVAEEADIAKVLGMTLKVVGTLPLVFFGWSLLNLVKNRTASVAKIFFFYFSAAELLQASNSLRVEYSTTPPPEDATAEKGRRGIMTRAGDAINRNFKKAQKMAQAGVRKITTDNSKKLEDVRLRRVAQVAARDTYLYSLFNWATRQDLSK